MSEGEGQGHGEGQGEGKGGCDPVSCLIILSCCIRLN